MISKEVANMELHELDTVLLKDGRKAAVVFLSPGEEFKDDDVLVDVGSSSKDWATIMVSRNDIVKVLQSSLEKTE
jgi:hypothetical protein